MLRRAPYSDNPSVGSRGLRTQQRILDAALQVFGEQGYERTRIDAIAKLAGCSRVAFYQYFAGKEDLFRQLTGQVARQLRAAVEGLDPLTPDEAGWEALRSWVHRDGDVFARYEPVFRAFGAAAESDADLVGRSQRTVERNVALFLSKLTTEPLPPRQLEPVVALLLAAVSRTFDMGAILRAAQPEAFTRARVEGAVADVVHRSLFGCLPGVNARPPGDPPRRTAIGGGLLAVFARTAELEQEAEQPGRRALASILEVGHDVVVRCGFQGTRVDDVVAAAGVSHGAFYRYFENRDDLVRVVAARSLNALSGAFADVPTEPDRAALRRWLRRYVDVHAAHGALLRVWMEAGGDDPLRAERAGVFDWGRRRLVSLLRQRALGDPEVEAVVLLAFVESFGARPRSAAELEAAVHVLEAGFLLAR